MPYDEQLNERVRSVIADWGTVCKRMFGGTCHLLHGNMLCGVYKEDLILRLGEAQGRAALDEPHTKPMAVTGKPMKGWIMVEQTGLSDAALQAWLKRAREFVETLPPK